jgi:hypothetical protein
MESPMSNATLARVAGAAGVAGQFAAAYVFVLIPALTVPSPVVYAFVIAWFVLLGLAILWWRSHPWRSFLVPVISVPSAFLMLALGSRFLGWVA